MQHASPITRFLMGESAQPKSQSAGPNSSAKETRQEYVSRLKDAVADINKSSDVEGLCRSFPERVAGVKKAMGDKLKK